MSIVLRSVSINSPCRRTLRAWAKDKAQRRRLGKRVAQQRTLMAGGFEDLARHLLGLSEKKIARANVLQAVTAAAIALDEMLLRGNLLAPHPADPHDGEG